MSTKRLRRTVAALILSLALLAEPLRAEAAGYPATTDATATVEEGDLDITQPGTVVENADVHGFIRVRADNVVIRNVIVRGRPVDDGVPRGLIKNTAGAHNLLIENSLLTDDHPSVHTTAGILGGNFTARHVEVRGAVDSIQIHGGTAVVEDSWLHDPHWYAHDPQQGGGPTHNDGVQILGGYDIVLRNNTITGAPNFGVLAAPVKHPVTGLQVRGNHIGDGYCAMRFSSYGGKGLSAQVGQNVVEQDQTSRWPCGLNVVRGTAVNTWDNRYVDGSLIEPVVTAR